MIVQACLNGARQRGFHPQLPLTAETIASDGAECVAAGAAELHFHPRGPDGHESLGSIDETIRAVRRTCPGTLVGVSTGAWIENNVEATRVAIKGWNELPDYASVNLSEPDALAITELLKLRGIGIEAGLASVADAERLTLLPDHERVFRILIEIQEQDLSKAVKTVDDILLVLGRVGRPILLHGFDATVWPLIRLARQRRWSTRVGLEDGKHLPDGADSANNAALVAAAMKIYRFTSATG
jgi:uncharacterized protein (DUF849 family)